MVCGYKLEVKSMIFSSNVLAAEHRHVSEGRQMGSTGVRMTEREKGKGVESTGTGGA